MTADLSGGNRILRKDEPRLTHLVGEHERLSAGGIHRQCRHDLACRTLVVYCKEVRAIPSNYFPREESVEGCLGRERSLYGAG